MNIRDNTKKISIRKIKDLNDIDYDKLMYPVIMYGKEKLENNMYDDWDEYEHTRKMIKELKQDSKIDIYYIEEENLVVGICFLIYGREYMEDFFNKIRYLNHDKIDNSAQLSCFHILKKYRGIGAKWIKEVIFPDLIKNNIEEIYVKSSHNKALHFYQKLGEQIGRYIGISDNELYQRLGYIYKIIINGKDDSNSNIEMTK